MDVNITIFVQIINFLIAYVIIRYLLLEPAVEAILQEEEHAAQLDKKLHALEATNKSKQERLTREWAAYQQESTKHAPLVVEARQTLENQNQGIETAPALDEKVVKPMADRIIQELTERLSHVR